MSLDDDFSQRELCPDGACVGVIGHDGRCKVCGRVGLAEVRDPRRAFVGSEPAQRSPLPGVPPSSSAADTGAAADDDFAQRQLCPDGVCIGIVGADGRCKVCGRTTEANA